MKLKIMLQILSVAIALATPVTAATINWNCEVDSVFTDSRGNSLDGTYAVQLGFFAEVSPGVGFVPTPSNASDWTTYWKVFDQATFVPGDDASHFGYFTSTARLKADGSSSSTFADAGVDFSGKSAYIWINNTETPGPLAEWFLGRSATAGGGTAAWNFPAKPADDCCDTALEEWSISEDLDILDTPLYGRQGPVIGPGEYTSSTGVNVAQTFTFIPEPSSTMLMALGGLVLAFRRRRPDAACSSKETVLSAHSSGSRLVHPSAGKGISQICGLLCLASWFAGSDCRAERIDWNSLDGLTNLTSAGAPMDGGFNFELGVFSGDFVPTSANVAQWAVNWVPAQRVAYTGIYNQFVGRFNVKNNTAPFTVGKPAYIWVYRLGISSSEWILFRKDTWNWPAPNLLNPLPLHWNTAEATAIIGKIDSDGAPFLMESAAVTASSPTPTWEQWSDIKLGAVENAPSDDSDRDGTSNLLEFVFGTAPNEATPPPVPTTEVVTIGTQQFLQISLPPRADHLATLLTVQVSSDFSKWTSGPTATTTVIDTPEAWIVRDLTPITPAAPRRFIRLKAELINP